MLRIPNPGSDISNYIIIYCALYEDLGMRQWFDIDDITVSLIKRNLATSSGYMGEEALRRSTRKDRSRDPLYNQSKMYSEVFRMLGWFHATDSSSQFACTYLGAHIPEVSHNPQKLVSECLLGIAYPNEVLDVKTGGKLRPFATILKTMDALGGLLHRDEMIVGPLCLKDDRDPEEFEQMIHRILMCRQSGWERLQEWIGEVSTSRRISTDTMENYTRFPLAAMKWCYWVYTENRKDVYNLKRKTPFLVLTDEGKSLVSVIENAIDIRGVDIKEVDQETKATFIRVGVFDALERAGFTTEPYRDQIEKDRDVVQAKVGDLEGKQILFSPFQELSSKDLGFVFMRAASSPFEVVKPSLLVAYDEAETEHHAVTLIDGQTINPNDLEIEIRQLFMPPLVAGLSIKEVVDKIFYDLVDINKGKFYPLIASMFRSLGLECQHSRAGVNYDRADAFIVHSRHSIPIEIKSPGEEVFISVKAVRQALENKIILLSRGAHPTERHTTSLVVGYNLPNDRSEVSSLISDIYTVFDINIGVLDLRSLLYLVALKIINGKTVNFADLSMVRGIIDVHNTSPETT